MRAKFLVERLPQRLGGDDRRITVDHPDTPREQGIHDVGIRRHARDEERRREQFSLVHGLRNTLKTRIALFGPVRTG